MSRRASPASTSRHAVTRSLLQPHRPIMPAQVLPTACGASNVSRSCAPLGEETTATPWPPSALPRAARADLRGDAGGHPRPRRPRRRRGPRRTSRRRCTGGCRAHRRPGTPLFFGRLDYGRRPADRGERFYIGRRHVHDDARRPGGHRLAGRDLARVLPGQPAPSRWASRCAGGSGSQRGQITAYEDEHLLDRPRHEPAAAAILADEIERPRVGPMRDIVATIQPEQDDIVRADVDRDACACRARPAPARPRSACTGRRTCSTRTATGCAAAACWSSAPTRRSSPTSPPCCPRSARSTCSR